MAPEIKITYFDAMALAEPTRLLLKYGGIDFEDIRVDRGDWPALKPQMPFGQMPILEEDGKVAHQSLALARYAGHKVKLAGETDWENLEIDSVVDTFNDLRLKIGQYSYEQNAVAKEERKGPLFSETIPYYLERLDKIAEKNNGHLALGKLTWADMYFVGVLDYVNYMAETELITEKYPNLQAVKENVLSIPSIKNWVETRPKNDL